MNSATKKLFALLPNVSPVDAIVVYVKRRIYKIKKEIIPGLRKEQSSLEHHRGMVTKFFEYRYYDEEGVELKADDIDKLIVKKKAEIRYEQLMTKKLEVFLESLLQQNDGKGVEHGEKR